MILILNDLPPKAIPCILIGNTLHCPGCEYQTGPHTHIICYPNPLKKEDT
jgi:hypothetical protein